MARWTNRGARFRAEDGPRQGQWVVSGETFEAPEESLTVRRRRHKLVRAGPEIPADGLDALRFGSEAALDLARQKELTADDFQEREPSGMDGYLVRDVEEVAGA